MIQMTMVAMTQMRMPYDDDSIDADIDDDKLENCGEKELNKRSQIKNKINDAVEK